MFTNTLRFAAATIAVLLLTGAADARPRHHHSRHSIGACDGFHRCRCGVTAARKAGLPLNYNGYNLKRAIEFKWALPPTTIHVGAIGYVPHGGPSGHVFTVVHYAGGNTATVYDDKGTYERNISGATFVDPNGNTAFSARGKPQKMATASAAVSYSHGDIGQ